MPDTLTVAGRTAMDTYWRNVTLAGNDNAWNAVAEAVGGQILETSAKRIAALEADLARERQLSAARAEVVAAEKAWRMVDTSQDDALLTGTRHAARRCMAAYTALADVERAIAPEVGARD